MSEPDDEVRRYLGQLPFKLRRELAQFVGEEGEALRSDIEEAAPKGETLALSKSVRVRRRRSSLELEVVAGGDPTTKGTRGPDGAADYALFQEYGTERMPAQPFFYPTATAFRPGYEQRLEAKVEDILDRA